MSDLDDLDDDFWEDLLENMERGRVVPIIGPEVITVVTDSGDTTLQRYLATELAQSLEVPEALLPGQFTVNDVAREYLEQPRAKKSRVHSRIRKLLTSAELKPSARLLDLARLDCFDLFVTVNFDSLLVDAINAARYGGNPRTEVMAYEQDKRKDLREDRNGSDPPVVYHLFGNTEGQSFAVYDDDLLEFLQCLQDRDRRPDVLFDQLQNKNLLILGCNFADWLTRFFLRLAKNQPLSDQRDVCEVLVDERAYADENLKNYLRKVSTQTTLLGDTNEFIDKLTEAWVKEHGGDEPAPEPPNPKGAEGGADKSNGQTPRGSVFLSYASDDKDAVARIQSALEDVGVDVWFDKSELKSGHDWDQEIRRNIEGCSLFMPVVSEAAAGRLEGYFRAEWTWADKRVEKIAPGVPFVVPIRIDDTSPEAAKVPETFHRAQWTHLPDGNVPPEFSGRIQELIRDWVRARHGRPTRA